MKTITGVYYVALAHAGPFSLYASLHITDDLVYWVTFNVTKRVGNVSETLERFGSVANAKQYFYEVSKLPPTTQVDNPKLKGEQKQNEN